MTFNNKREVTLAISFQNDNCKYTRVEETRKYGVLCRRYVTHDYIR